jgi:hypothetical protein
MGLFDVFKKKSITFRPDNYFLDILGDKISISTDNEIDNFALHSYFNTPQLAAIINYSAKVAANNDLRFYNDNGEEQENDILKLFNNPHPLYSEGEFWETFFKQYDLYNIVLTYKVRGVGQDVSGLFILPYHRINIVAKKNLTPGDIFFARDLNDIISHYELEFEGKEYKIDVDDVWMVTGSSLKFEDGGYLQPDNIVESLKYPIKNIQANYEARYSLTNNRGMLGLWVNKSADAVGIVPLEDKEKKDIYSYFRKSFGLKKNKDLVGITNANLGFESASLPVKDMEFSEGISQDKIALCDAFNFPILLLNELEGSTYSNLDIADRNLYTKKTIPIWELIAKSVTREFLESGYVQFYTGDIEVLKKDDKTEAETNKINTDLVISLNNTNSMDYESKINTLVLIADVPEDIAREVITDKPNTNESELLLNED